MFGTEWKRCRIVLRAFECFFEPLLSHHDVSQTKFSSTLSPMNKEKMQISWRSWITLLMEEKVCIISREDNGFPYLLCLQQRSKTSSCYRQQNSGSAPAQFGLPVANKRSCICFKTNRQYRLVQREYKTQEKCIFKAGPTFKLILFF